MNKRLSAAEIRELQESGARVNVVKKVVPHETPGRETLPAKNDSPTIAEQAMFELASTMTASQRALLEQVAVLLQSMHATDTKPTAYQFTIKRDRKGLIESIDAIPMD
jgi:hypothetical protein